MTIINPKSIAGVTSITTASGADNLLTVHTNNTTERVRINNDGDVIVGSGITVSPDGDIFATGVSTVTTLKVGSGVTVSSDGDIFATGVCTATSFVGDGSALTNITSTTINSNADNRLITGSGTANTLNGESALTFDGATLDIDGGTTDTPLILDTSATAGAHLRFRKDGSNVHFVGAGGGFSLGDAEDLSLRGYDNILFATGNSSTERARIDSSGKLGVGNNNPSFLLDLKATSSADVLRLGNTAESSHGNADVKIVAGGSYYQNFDFQASTYKFQTYNGSSLGERVRITSDGKIGIGLDSPNCLLHIQDAAISGYGSQSSTLLVVEDTGDTSIEIASGYNNTGSIFFGDTGSSAKAKIQYFHGSGGDNMRFSTNDSERMRILSDGSVLIGRTSASSFGNFLETKNITVETDGDTTGMYFNRTDSNSAWVAMRFYIQQNQKGYIQVNVNDVTYSTGSDYRLKENAVSISDGITRLKQLKPYKFNWKSTPSGDKVDGFFAHEVSDIVPQAISGEKDAVDKDGNPDHQVIDHSKLVPLLTAALQEAVAKIEVLETRLNNAGIAT